jgi:chromosome segregation ATPase
MFIGVNIAIDHVRALNEFRASIETMCREQLEQQNNIHRLEMEAAQAETEALQKTYAQTISEMESKHEKEMALALHQQERAISDVTFQYSTEIAAAKEEMERRFTVEEAKLNRLVEAAREESAGLKVGIEALQAAKAHSDALHLAEVGMLKEKLEQCIREHEKEKSELNAQNNSLQNAIAELRTQLTDVHSSNETAMQALRERHAEQLKETEKLSSEKMTSELHKWIGMTRNFLKEITRLRSEIACSMTSVINSHHKDVHAIEAEIMDFRRQHIVAFTQLVKQHEEVKLHEEELQTEVTHLHEELLQIHAAHEQALTEESKNQKELDVLKLQINNLLEENKQLQEQMQIACNERQRLCEEVQLAKQEELSLHRKQERLCLENEEVRKIEAERHAREMEMAKAQQEAYAKSCEELMQLKRTVETLQGQLAAMESEHQAVVENLREQHDVDKADLQARLAAEQQNTLQSALGNVDGLRAELLQLQDTNHILKSENQDLKSQLAVVDCQKSELSEQLQCEKDTNAELNFIVSAEKEKHVELLEELSDIRKGALDSERRCEELLKQKEILDEQLTTVSQNLLSSEALVKGANEAEKLLNEQVRQLKENCEQIGDTNKLLHEQVCQLRAELDSTKEGEKLLSEQIYQLREEHRKIPQLQEKLENAEVVRKQLSEQISLLRGDLESTSESKQQLAKQITQLKEALEKDEDARTRLNEQIQQRNGELESVESAKTQLTEQVRQLKKDLEDKHDINISLSEEVRRLQADIVKEGLAKDQLCELTNNMRQEIVVKDDMIKRLNEQLHQVKFELEHAEDAKNLMSKQVHELMEKSEEAVNAKNTLSQLTNELQSSEEVEKQLNGQIVLLEAELRHTEDGVKLLEEQIDLLKRENEGLQSQLSEIKADKQCQSENLQVVQLKLAIAEDRLQKVEVDRAPLEAKWQECSALSQKLEKELQEVGQINSSLCSQNEELQKKLNALNTDLEASYKDIETLQNRLQASEKLVTLVNQCKDSMESQLAETRNDLDQAMQLNAELKLYSNELSDENRKLSACKDSMEGELTKVKESCLVIKQKFKSSKADKHILEGQLKTVSEEKKGLLDQLTGCKDAIRRHEDQLRELRQEIIELGKVANASRNVTELFVANVQQLVDEEALLSSGLESHQGEMLDTKLLQVVPEEHVDAAKEELQLSNSAQTSLGGEESTYGDDQSRATRAELAEFRSKIIKIKEQLELSESLLARAVATRQVIKDQLSQLDLDNKKCQHLLADYRERHNSLVACREQYKEENENIAVRLSLLEEQNIGLSNENSMLMTKLQDTEKELKFANDSFEELHCQLKDANCRTELLEKQLDTIKNANLGTASEFESSLKEKLILEDQMKSLRDVNNVLQNANDKLDEHRQRVEDELKEEKARIESLECLLQDQQLLYQQLKEDHSTLCEDLSKMKKERELLEKQLHEEREHSLAVCDELKKLATENESLNNLKDSLSKELNSLRTDLLSMQAADNDLDSAMKQLLQTCENFDWLKVTGLSLVNKGHCHETSSDGTQKIFDTALACQIDESSTELKTVDSATQDSLCNLQTCCSDEDLMIRESRESRNLKIIKMSQLVLEAVNRLRGSVSAWKERADREQADLLQFSGLIKRIDAEITDLVQNDVPSEWQVNESDPLTSSVTSSLSDVADTTELCDSTRLTSDSTFAGLENLVKKWQIKFGELVKRLAEQDLILKEKDKYIATSDEECAKIKRKFLTKWKSLQAERQKEVEMFTRELSTVNESKLLVESTMADLVITQEELKKKCSDLQSQLNDAEECLSEHVRLLKRLVECQDIEDDQLVGSVGDLLPSKSLTLLEEFKAELFAVQLTIKKYQTNAVSMQARICELELQVANSDKCKMEAVASVQQEGKEQLADLKRRAEARLVQIKHQWQIEKESVMKEQKDMIEELRARNLAAEDERADAVRQLQDVEQRTAEAMAGAQNELAELRRDVKEQEEKARRLEIECAKLERKLSDSEKQRLLIAESHEVDTQAAKLRLEHELEKLKSEYSEKFKDAENDHNAKIKQLLKEFTIQLAEKENEHVTSCNEILGGWCCLSVT